MDDNIVRKGCLSIKNKGFSYTLTSDGVYYDDPETLLPYEHVRGVSQGKEMVLNLGCKIKFRAPASSEEKDWKEFINFFGTHI